jgi:uncharacterized protein YrrD
MIKSRKLIGKPIVTITKGEIIGRVRDVLVDPVRFEIAALVLPGKLLSRETIVLPRSVVSVFGRDVILVKGDEAMPKDDSLEQVASLIAVSRQMKGREVATEKGVRVGVLDDVVVDENGKVIAYHLAKVFIKGPVAGSKQIPLQATRSVGPDILIVDTDAIGAPSPSDVAS